MRKSNIIIIAILVVASVFFLWLWNYLGFSLIDGKDLIITIVWWVLIIAVCLAIRYVEKKRRERMRTMYLSDRALYNSEAGIIALTERTPRDYVDGMREVLRNLDYIANAKLDSNETRLRFRFIVHTQRFSDDGSRWEGNVIRVSQPGEAIPFADADELEGIIAGTA